MAQEWSENHAVPDRALGDTLTAAQLEKYGRDGWVVVTNVFSEDECAALTTHMADKHAPDGEWPEPPGLSQPHLTDDTIRHFMLHPKLRLPLRDVLGDEPDGIKSYYWWRGSDWSQGWVSGAQPLTEKPCPAASRDTHAALNLPQHCDGTPLPGCVGAWLPLVDVDVAIGTLGLMTGSHRGRRIHHDDLREGKFGGQRTHSGDGDLRAQLTADILAGNRAGGMEEVRVVAPRGSAVLFSGHLFHRGVMGQDPAAMRHVLATHYIPRGFAEWPHVLWERLNFDGTTRWSTGDEPTEASRINARLPAHPGMRYVGDQPSLLPCRRDAPLQILTPNQRDELDLRGFTVIEDAFALPQIDALTAEIDAIEAQLNPQANDTQGRPPPSVAQRPPVEPCTKSGARIRSISDVEAITFTSGLVMRSAACRAFCGDQFFQKACHDVLNCADVRLYHDQSVYKKPCPGRSFPFHQDNVRECLRLSSLVTDLCLSMNMNMKMTLC